MLLLQRLQFPEGLDDDKHFFSGNEVYFKSIGVFFFFLFRHNATSDLTDYSIM